MCLSQYLLFFLIRIVSDKDLGGNITWTSFENSFHLKTANCDFSLLLLQGIYYLLTMEENPIDFQHKLENVQEILFLLLSTFQPGTGSKFCTRRLLHSSVLGTSSWLPHHPLLFSEDLIATKGVQHFAWFEPFSKWVVLTLLCAQLAWGITHRQISKIIQLTLQNN